MLFFFWIFAQKKDKFGDEFLKDFLVGFLLQELGFLVGQTQGWYVHPLLTYVYVTMDSPTKGFNNQTDGFNNQNVMDSTTKV